MHIAVGVISDANGRILISERKPDCAYAGQWEFPGGKCEPGEDVPAALCRELHEELDIEVESSRPLIRYAYRYPDRHVLLDTWRVTAWQGVPKAREGQRFAWVSADELGHYPMLAANQPIVRAARLPGLYLFTPEPDAGLRVFEAALEGCLERGIKLVRLRAPRLSRDTYAELARRCLVISRRFDAELLLDREPEMVDQLGADGLHLTTAGLAGLSQRPVPAGKWLAASCHTRAELEKSVALGADFVVLGPLAETPSHPGKTGLGWETFGRSVNDLPIPVYAIGGLGPGDLETAWSYRAQGIAAIRGLWKP